MLMTRSESDLLLYIWPGSDINALSQQDQFGLNKARSDPFPAKQIRTISGISVQGLVLMARSELGRSVYVPPAQFQYRCVIQDPFGLNKARSDPLPAKQVGTIFGIYIQGRMIIARSESVLRHLAWFPAISMPNLFWDIWPGSWRRYQCVIMSRICLD